MDGGEGLAGLWSVCRVKDAKLAKGGTIVLRPDSGDPVQQVRHTPYRRCGAVGASGSDAVRGEQPALRVCTC
jgi:hypothetical protein